MVDLMRLERVALGWADQAWFIVLGASSGMWKMETAVEGDGVVEGGDGEDVGWWAEMHVREVVECWGICRLLSARSVVRVD